MGSHASTVTGLAETVVLLPVESVAVTEMFSVPPGLLPGHGTVPIDPCHNEPLRASDFDPLANPLQDTVTPFSGPLSSLALT
jgi:hypothetical protein